MDTVTLSDQAKAVAALAEERSRLFAEADTITTVQRTLLQDMQRNSARHAEVLKRIIAIEEAQAKLLRPL